MDHVNHIQKNKILLDLRFEITKQIRTFFWSKNFQEVEAPSIIKLPSQEPYLSPMTIAVHDEKGNAFPGFLHTSPEYAMKKMLAAGYTHIFSLGKCYRDYESFGGLHNPEFTMLEWYRTNADMFDIMDDVEDLFRYIQNNLQSPIPNLRPFEKKSMKNLWKTYAHVDLDDHLTEEALFELCEAKGYKPNKNESYEDLFYRIFLNEIEPKLKDQNLIIHNYPAQMAALSKISDKNPRYAERFEVYMDGIELANAFTELTDANEQKRRLEEEQKQREGLEKDVFDIDEEFISAVGQLPECAGIALGVDRLAQLFADCQNIDDVLPLPASKLFKKE